MFDSDDILKPKKIELQAKFLDKYRDVCFVFKDFCDFKGERKFQSHLSRCTIFSQLTNEKVGPNRYIIRNVDCYNTLLDKNFIGGSSMMFRASLLDDIGTYDENLEVS